MPRRASLTLGDRRESLLAQLQRAQDEVTGLRQEEEYLVLQIRQAREQVRYYEGLLALLRRDWGKTPALKALVRKLD